MRRETIQIEKKERERGNTTIMERGGGVKAWQDNMIKQFLNHLKLKERL